MWVRGGFGLMLTVLLFSVTTSLAGDEPHRIAIRAPSTMLPELNLESSASLTPAPPSLDLRETKTLAWLLLLMRDGRSAR
jgi:hypothetical protein